MNINTANDEGELTMFIELMFLNIQALLLKVITMNGEKSDRKMDQTYLRWNKI